MQKWFIILFKFSLIWAHQIQSSNVIKRSTPYLLFCRVLLCCAALKSEHCIQALSPFTAFSSCCFACSRGVGGHFRGVYSLSPEGPSSHSQSSSYSSVVLVMAVTSHFRSMRGCMLRRSCVDIRVCPTEVAILCAILSMCGSVSRGRCGAILGGRRSRDLPPMLGRWVAA